MIQYLGGTIGNQRNLVNRLYKDNKDKYYKGRLNLHYTDSSNDSDTNYNINSNNINTGGNTNHTDTNTNPNNDTDTNDSISYDNYSDRKMWQTV